MMVTNYTLCSEESKPNQNKNEQTSPPPIPREQQEGMQESYRAHGFQGHSMASGSGGAFNSATSICLHLVSMTRQKPRTAKLPTNLCLNTTSFSFISFSRIRVCFLHERSAVGDCCEGLTPSFLNTDFTSLKASLRTPTQRGGGREGGLDGAVLKTEGKKKTKPNQTIQVHLFLNKRRS